MRTYKILATIAAIGASLCATVLFARMRDAKAVRPAFSVNVTETWTIVPLNKVVQTRTKTETFWHDGSRLLTVTLGGNLLWRTMIDHENNRKIVTEESTRSMSTFNIGAVKTIQAKPAVCTGGQVTDHKVLGRELTMFTKKHKLKNGFTESTTKYLDPTLNCIEMERQVDLIDPSGKVNQHFTRLVTSVTMGEFSRSYLQQPAYIERAPSTVMALMGPMTSCKRQTAENFDKVYDSHKKAK